MGTYLSNSVYVDSKGGLWVYGRNGEPTLGGFWDAGGGWSKISELASPIAGGFGQWLANKGAPQQQYIPPAGAGAYAGFSPTSGLMGGMDMTTLLLLGLGGVALFMVMKK
jgi:hypothetical protein